MDPPNIIISGTSPEEGQSSSHNKRRQHVQTADATSKKIKEFHSGDSTPSAPTSISSSIAHSVEASPQASPSLAMLALPPVNPDLATGSHGPSRRKKRQRARDKERRKKKKEAAVALGQSSGSSSPENSLSPPAPESPNMQPLTLLVTPKLSDSDSENPTDPDLPTQKQTRNKVRDEARRTRKREIENARDLLLFASAEWSEEEIRDWAPELILERAKAIEGQILEGDNGGKVWLVDVDQRERSRTPDKSIYEGVEPDLTEERIKSEKWAILTHGRIYGYRTVNGKKTLVFAARFCPYAEMSPEELDDIRFLAKHFHMLGRLFNPIRTNAAMTGGIMFAEGWRKAYEALFSLGLYKLARNGIGKPEEYAQFLMDMERASSIYACRYKRLAPGEYLRSLNFMEESCVPRFGCLEPETENPTSFGSNLTVTWGDFRNKYHYDNDASPRAAGSWFVVTDDGDLVMDPEEIRRAVEGGYFALPSFKFAVDFSACPGVIDLMWSSMDDLHATSQSITQKGYRRIGSSIQVPKRVADITAKMQEMDPSQRPIAGAEIRMLEIQMKLG
ncbi:hypothetical protein FRC11_003139 [Ceratobasidium sp. 423]|nr:hypothetical protein FRC11_003139 [Ceratobasidium sp. 423]